MRNTIAAIGVIAMLVMVAMPAYAQTNTDRLVGLVEATNNLDLVVKDIQSKIDGIIAVLNNILDKVTSTDTRVQNIETAIARFPDTIDLMSIQTSVNNLSGVPDAVHTLQRSVDNIQSRLDAIEANQKKLLQDITVIHVMLRVNADKLADVTVPSETPSTATTPLPLPTDKPIQTFEPIRKDLKFKIYSSDFGSFGNGDGRYEVTNYALAYLTITCSKPDTKIYSISGSLGQTRYENVGGPLGLYNTIIMRNGDITLYTTNTNQVVNPVTDITYNVPIQIESRLYSNNFITLRNPVGGTINFSYEQTSADHTCVSTNGSGSVTITPTSTSNTGQTVTGLTPASNKLSGSSEFRDSGNYLLVGDLGSPIAQRGLDKYEVNKKLVCNSPITLKSFTVVDYPIGYSTEENKVYVDGSIVYSNNFETSRNNFNNYTQGKQYNPYPSYVTGAEFNFAMTVWNGSTVPTIASNPKAVVYEIEVNGQSEYSDTQCEFVGSTGQTSTGTSKTTLIGLTSGETSTLKGATTTLSCKAPATITSFENGLGNFALSEFTKVIVNGIRVGDLNAQGNFVPIANALPTTSSNTFIITSQSPHNSLLFKVGYTSTDECEQRVN